jgi:hypothetical protein
MDRLMVGRVIDAIASFVGSDRTLARINKRFRIEMERRISARRFRSFGELRADALSAVVHSAEEMEAACDASRFAHMRHVHASCCELTDRAVRAAAGSAVASLRLSFCARGEAPLPAMPRLRVLSVVGGAAPVALGHPSRLVLLNVSSTGTGDAECERIAEHCPLLQTFVCVRTRVTHAGLARIAQSCAALRRLECGANRLDSTFPFLFGPGRAVALGALSLCAVALRPEELRRICAECGSLRALDISYNAHTLGPEMQSMTELARLTRLVQLCIVGLEEHIHPERAADMCADSIRIIQCIESRIRPYRSERVTFVHSNMPSFDESICSAWR